jgi:hypothetical protein
LNIFRLSLIILALVGALDSEPVGFFNMIRMSPIVLALLAALDAGLVAQMNVSWFYDRLKDHS